MIASRHASPVGRSGDRDRPLAKNKRTDLPRKTCLSCGRPFAWRRKWLRCWDEVKYCSERCKRQSKASVEPKS
ncbi:MAG: DUF2256 domain-containing protein [Rubripirellula sp.]